MVPEIVPSEQLVQANSLSSASRLLGSEFVGPAVGGLLVAAGGTAVAFGLNAASFALSLAALVAMRRLPRPAPSGKRILAELRVGARYVRSQRWLWIALLMAGAANFLFSGSVVILGPILLKTKLHGGASALGFLFGAFGLGGGITAVVVGQLGAPRRRVTTMYLGWAAAGLAVGAFGVAPNVTILVVLALIAGMVLELGNIIWPALLQDLVPRDLLGRVSSLDWFMSLGLQPLSFAAAVPVAALLGLSTTLIAAGVLDTAVVIFALTRPGARDPERIDSSFD
jgi:MFS family permease